MGRRRAGRGGSRDTSATYLRPIHPSKLELAYFLASSAVVLTTLLHRVAFGCQDAAPSQVWHSMHVAGLWCLQTVLAALLQPQEWAGRVDAACIVTDMQEFVTRDCPSSGVALGLLAVPTLMSGMASATRHVLWHRWFEASLAASLALSVAVYLKSATRTPCNMRHAPCTKRHAPRPSCPLCRLAAAAAALAALSLTVSHVAPLVRPWLLHAPGLDRIVGLGAASSATGDATQHAAAGMADEAAWHAAGVVHGHGLHAALVCVQCCVPLLLAVPLYRGLMAKLPGSFTAGEGLLVTQALSLTAAGAIRALLHRAVALGTSLMVLPWLAWRCDGVACGAWAWSWVGPHVPLWLPARGARCRWVWTWPSSQPEREEELLFVLLVCAWVLGLAACTWGCCCAVHAIRNGPGDGSGRRRNTTGHVPLAAHPVRVAHGHAMAAWTTEAHGHAMAAWTTEAGSRCAHGTEAAPDAAPAGTGATTNAMHASTKHASDGSAERGNAGCKRPQAFGHARAGCGAPCLLVVPCVAGACVCALALVDLALWAVLRLLAARPVARVATLAGWAACLAAALPGMLWLQQHTARDGGGDAAGAAAARAGLPLILLRKGYHALALALFAPPLLSDGPMLRCSLAVAFAALVFAELLRCADVPVVGPALRAFCERFADERDQGPVYVTHIALLLGMAAPMWLARAAEAAAAASAAESMVTGASASGVQWCSAGHEGPSTAMAASWLIVAASGLSCLGLGDSAASCVGVLAGRIRPFASSRKTAEGTAAGAVAMLLGWVGLAALLGVIRPHGMQPALAPWWALGCVGRLSAATAGAALLEAVTHQLDNLVVPVFYAAHLLLLL